MKRLKILAFVDYYLPGYKSGGPVRTLSNMVTHLKEQVDFWIVTKDRDYQDAQPYAEVQVGNWNEVNGAQVFYLREGPISPFVLRRLIKGCQPDYIYLNSLFARSSMLISLLQRLFFLPSAPVILAPRGECTLGALSLKASRKKVYLKISKVLGLHRNIRWHASTPIEANQIRELFPKAEIAVAANMPQAATETVIEIEKNSGSAEFIFLSRIAEVKNLLMVLKVLRKVEGHLGLSIYGTLEQNYWEKCLVEIGRLPDNITVQYHGPAPHEKVFTLLSQHHFFVLPTLGENFGHSIFEAMLAGRPVLISDTTPWRNLHEQGCGWDLSLDNTDLWKQQIEQCIDMEQQEFTQLSKSTRDFAEKWLEQADLMASNLRVFEKSE